MTEKILITPKSFKKYKENAYKLLTAQGYEIIENNLGRTMTEEEIIKAAQDNVVGIIIGVDPLPKGVLIECKSLRAISKYGVGLDNIDLEAASELGIPVKNAVGTNSISVAEHAIALMFAAARQLTENASGVKKYGWDRSIGFELTNKKLGIVGGGNIGKEVAKRAVGLGMNVSIYDPYFNDSDFLEIYEVNRVEDLFDILSDSDIISLHLPATKDTSGLINADVLKLMKPNAVLINTSRGELVDEAALYNALVNKEIAFAAQDVYSSEPPRDGDALVALPNFILTPHVGAYTQEAVERMVMISTENLLDLLGKKEVTT